MLPAAAIAGLGLALATILQAQTPSYTGILLIEPGNNNGKCLAASDSEGSLVSIQSCTNNADQKWTFPGDGTIRTSSKCLETTGVNNGAKLRVSTCIKDKQTQHFYYTREYRITQGKDYCLDLPSGNLVDGTKVQLWKCGFENANQVWNTGYSPSALPKTSERGQVGQNACSGGSSQSSNCQTLWINSVEDFCLWAPRNPSQTIGESEREEVAWCTKAGHGTRVIPAGTFHGVHFVKTRDYVQITGVGDFTKINIKKGDDGGELDPHGADGNGNPIGGLVFGNSFGNNLQYHEWTNFMSANEFCIRACTGPNAAKNCQHIYDVMGCAWNMPANYSPGVFETCDADNDLPMGIYGTSTWHQGTKPTPAAHPAASSSNCRNAPSPTPAPASHARSEEVLKRHARQKRLYGGADF